MANTLERLTVRPGKERGHFDFGWLDTYHTFSFADYFDPRFMGFRSLRVINEDRVAPGRGFPTHPHRDMEILTYILSGALEHKDSMGNGSVIVAGDVQRMTAGTGVTHSEYNASSVEPVHLLQIWILPESKQLPPSYEQKHFPLQDRRGRLQLVASRSGKAGSVVIHQDVNLYVGNLTEGQSLDVATTEDRFGWIQVARGSIDFNGTALHAGDGVALLGGVTATCSATTDTEFLYFDLA